jgi:HEAT repeat protein
MREQASRPPGLPVDLVHGLDDLQRGLEFQLRLICLGEAAVEPLGGFLLGPPSLHPQPRMLAAEALGAIGGPAATEVLITALGVGNLASLPLVYRLSEEAVRNQVARELGRMGDRVAVEPLLDALARSHLIEAGAALLAFGEPRAIPLLVECLDDDFLRERAAFLLFEYRRDAVPGLIAGLEGLAENETLRSAERRATCARVLGYIADPSADLPLRAHLADGQRPVRVAAAVALAHLCGRGAGRDVVAPLIEGLEAGDARFIDDCSEALAEIGAVAVPSILEALTLGAERDERQGERMPTAGVRAMARTLGQIEDAGVKALTTLSEHPCCFLRALAVAHLGRTDPEGAVAVISRALRDKDQRVRRTAAARLKQLGVRHDDRALSSGGAARQPWRGVPGQEDVRRGRGVASPRAHPGSAEPERAWAPGPLVARHRAGARGAGDWRI